jgi:hypothetical protein
MDVVQTYFSLLKMKKKSTNSVLFMFLGSSIYYTSHKINLGEEK